MGRVSCARHPSEPGELTCDHIAGSVLDGAQPQTTTIWVDFMDDGSHFMPWLLCADCCAAYRLDPRSMVLGSDWEARSDAYPYVAPMCVHCLAEAGVRVDPRP